MKTYSIEPASKKSIEVVEIWHHEELGVDIRITDLWRWGRWYLTCDEQTIDELRNVPDGTTTVIDDYDVELDFLDDGTGRWVDITKSPYETEEENEALQEHFERILDDDGYWGIEEAGWDCVASETYVHGEMVIEEVE